MPIENAQSTVVKFQAKSETPAQPTTDMERLALYITGQLDEMRRWRTETKLRHRMDRCLMQREGLYDTQQIQDIETFGGSQVFARLTTNKVRAGAASMRAIFIQGDAPWQIKPTPVPKLPDDIKGDIEGVVSGEAQTMAQAGQQVDPKAIKRRIQQLGEAAMVIARKQAKLDAIEATRYINDLFVEGGFYGALNEFILDFCSMPFAVFKGPFAVMKTDVDYVDGTPQRVRKPVLTYDRVDPYDILWSPGSASMDNADIIERMRLTRADLNSLIGLEGFDEYAVRSILREYGERGYRYEHFNEAIRDEVQNRESIVYSNTIDVLAFNGRMPGYMVRDFGIRIIDGTNYIDDDLDYMVQAWVCGRYTLKAQIDPDPSNRISYYAASYEPVPGSIAGTALPELLADIQEVYNAVLRALVNNIGLASGPQVSVNIDRWQDSGNGQVSLVPWKIWFYRSDPTSNTAEKPIDFFQPNMNAQELMNVMMFLQNMADEISGIPRYLSGSDRLGGAGRTSSGLSMLMGNANRTMVSVAGQIDQYVLEPLLKKTYGLVLLTTGTSVLRGDEEIEAKGATFAETREQDRMRQIEFLQTTANPFDMEIIGVDGRAELLRQIANNFANGDDIVPSEQELKQRAMMQQRQAVMQAQQGGQPGQDQQEQQSGGQRPGGQQPQQQGANPKKPQPTRDPRNEAARGTDNSARMRSPGAIRRQSGG